MWGNALACVVAYLSLFYYSFFVSTRVDIMTFASSCSLALTSEKPVLPTRSAALDFIPVHVHGFGEKANAAFDATRSTLTGVSSSLAQSAVITANYLCLAHDILAVLSIWLMAAARNYAGDHDDDRLIENIAYALSISILEKFKMLAGGAHSTAFWHDAPKARDLFAAILLDGQCAQPCDPPNSQAEAAIWPKLPDLLAAHNGPKPLKALISPRFAPAIALLPTAAQMGIYHLCYDLLSPKPIDRVSTIQPIEDSRDRVGTPLFQTLVCNLMAQKKNSPTFFEAKRVENCALLVAVSCCCLATVVSLVLVDVPYTGPMPAAAIVADVATYLESSMTERLFPYTLGSPGMQPSKGKSADGVKYLVQQLLVSGSAYKMPSPESSQQGWEDWFAKLTDMTVYYENSAETVIHAVSGHLPTTDCVMFGWTDTVATLRASSQAVTLNIFFEHIRKQLFVRQNTRTAAYDEFLMLKHDTKHMLDCNAFVTRLKQILGRLFPVATEEREPITKYDACLAIHDLLCKLWDMPLRLRKTSFLQAWHDWQFKSKSLYVSYLQPTKHTLTADSATACTDYISVICQQFQEAQVMHNTVNSVSQRMTRTYNTDVIAAAASQLGVSTRGYESQPTSSPRWISSLKWVQISQL
jgi:hypothetical protein